MKLLYVCSDFGIQPTGTKGASIHLRSITKALCELGHEVFLVSPHGSAGPGHPSRTLRAPARSAPLRITNQLDAWFQERNLTSRLPSELGPLLYGACVTPRLVDRIRHSPPDAVLERLSLFGHIGVDLARALNRPLILEVNALLSREARQFRRLELASTAEQIERQVLRKASEIIVVSEPLKASLASLGIKPSRIHVVPNGADPNAFRVPVDDFAIRRKLGINGEFVVGFVGSLKPWHGVDLLISAFQRLRADAPDSRLLIIGAGPMERQLQDHARRHRLDGAVMFTGAVEHEHVSNYLRAMDVAVAPFRNVPDFYFSPIKLFEYMAAERCIVASRLGQIGDVITDGVTGLLCEPDHVGDLAGALLRARHDPELRRRLATAARRDAERRFTWKRAAEALSRIIQRRIKRHGGGADRKRPAAIPLTA